MNAQQDLATQSPEELAQAWAAAEQRGDAAYLGRRLADDFVGVGPRGFLLSKAEWLERYPAGLTYESFRLSDLQVRRYDATAVLIGRQEVKGTYQGHSVDGVFRTTLILVAQNQDWLLAGLQLSPTVTG